jgi:hypothetical protein
MANRFQRHISVSSPNFYTNFFFGFLKTQWIIIWSLGIWTLGVDKLQAATENSVSPQQVTTENFGFLQVLENDNLPSEVTEPIVPVTEIKNFHLPPDSSVDGSSPEPHDKLNSLEQPPFLTGLELCSSPGRMNISGFFILFDCFLNKAFSNRKTLSELPN